MAKFNVINQTGSQIDLIIPAHHRVTSFSLMLPPSGSLNILPFAGTREACRHIRQILELETRGAIRIEEEA